MPHVDRTVPISRMNRERQRTGRSKSDRIMNAKSNTHFPHRAKRQKKLIILAGLLAIILIANGVIGLFALNYSNDNHLADLQTVGELAKAIESARSAQVHFKKQVQEWKNILLRGSNPADLAKHRAAFELEEHQMDEEIAALAIRLQKLNISSPEIGQLPKTHAALGSQYRNALETFHPEQLSSAAAVDQQVRGIDRAPTDQIDAIVKQIESHSEITFQKISQETAERYRTLRKVSIGGTSAGIIIVLAFLGLSFATLPKE